MKHIVQSNNEIQMIKKEYKYPSHSKIYIIFEVLFSMLNSMKSIMKTPVFINLG